MALREKWQLIVFDKNQEEMRFPLRARGLIRVGDNPNNDIVVDTTHVPSSFPCVRWNKKEIRVRLTGDVIPSLQGDCRKANQWNASLYSGFNFIVQGPCAWKIGQTQFCISKVNWMKATVEVDKEDVAQRMIWKKAIGGAFALQFILFALPAWFLGKNIKHKDVLLPLTVEEVAQLLKKEDPPPPPPPPKEISKEDEAKKSAGNSAAAKLKNSSNRAREGKKSAERPDVRQLGLLALQTAPSLEAGALDLPAAKGMAQVAMAETNVLGFGGLSDNGIGSGNSEDGGLVGIGELSGEGYGGGLGQGLGSGQGNSVALSRREVEVQGALDPEVIRQVIEDRMDEIRYCYEMQLQKHPNLRGKMAAVWTINSDGAVKDVNLNSQDMKEAAMNRCLYEKIIKWQFPSPKGGGVVHVRFPFLFNRTGT